MLLVLVVVVAAAALAATEPQKSEPCPNPSRYLLYRVLEPVGPYIVGTHRLLSSSFLGLPYRILTMNHITELLRSL